MNTRGPIRDAFEAAYDKHKSNVGFYSKEEILKKSTGWFNKDPLLQNTRIQKESTNRYILFGIVDKGYAIIFFTTGILFSHIDIWKNLSIEDVFIKYEDLFDGTSGTSGSRIEPNSSRLNVYTHGFNSFLISWKYEHYKFFRDSLDTYGKWLKKEKSKSDKKLRALEKAENDKLKAQLKKRKTAIFREFDSNDNGLVDSVEDEVYLKLLRKHQKSIINIDKKYISKLVKVSSYLKDKQANIQKIYSFIRIAKDSNSLEDYLGILRNEIFVYQSIMASGLLMITALIEDDLITYEEIYDVFDRSNIFDSKWEQDISNKLSEIDNKLEDILNEIEYSNSIIISELVNLKNLSSNHYIELQNTLSSELQSIGSSLKLNNLLAGIQSYQVFKLNKKLGKQ